MRLATVRCLVLVLAAAAAPAAAQRDRRPASTIYPPERIDDAPAGRHPRQDPAARSVATNVLFGFYGSIQVNIDSGGANIVGDAANEPTIAVNPTNPDNIIIAWRQFDTISSNFRQAGTSYTTDGGATWTFPGSLTPGTFRSDPVLDFDAQGGAYYQSLRLTAAQELLLDVFPSGDGGVSWGAPVPSFGGDKNWMAVDRSGGIGDGNIYGIWQRFFACCGVNVLTRSTDGGATYQAPVPLALSPTFGMLAVGPDGELYAAGIDGTTGQDVTTFVVSRSLDAQDPSASPTSSGVIVDLGGSMAFSAGPNPGGLLGQANIAVDHSTGPTRGNVYLLASVDPPDADPLDVYFARSEDGGATWSPPIRVNNDAIGQGWQWFGALSVAPDGRIDVIWNDSRNGGAANFSQLFYAYSHDAGDTWLGNIPVGPIFNSLLGFPQQNKIGDYIGIVSDDMGADAAYAATYNGEQDVYYVRLFPDCNDNGLPDGLEIELELVTDCDGSRVPDLCEAASGCIGGGDVPAATPLTVTRSSPVTLALDWGTSCSAGDSDYAVYEGAMPSFGAYTSRLCSTGGRTSATISPIGGSTFYLVVPLGGGWEGSYGRDGDGVERAPGLDACLPHQILDCSLAP